MISVASATTRDSKTKLNCSSRITGDFLFSLEILKISDLNMILKSKEECSASSTLESLMEEVTFFCSSLMLRG